MTDPRDDAELSYQAFKSMKDSEWLGLLESLRSGGVLRPEESKGFLRALRERGNPLAPLPKPAPVPDHIKPKTKVEHEVTDNDLKEMCARFVQLKDEKDDLEEKLKAINKELDGWEDKETGEVHAGLHEKIYEVMVAKGFDLVRVPALASFWPKPENYPSISENDMPYFIQWLDEHQMGMIAKRTVHWQTLKGWVNDRLKNNEEVPKMVNVAIKMKIGYRRTNPK